MDRDAAAGRSDLKVEITALDTVVAFAAGEEIRTEISAKFRRERVEQELAAAGLRLSHWWTDHNGDFALSLSTPRLSRRKISTTRVGQIQWAA